MISAVEEIETAHQAAATLLKRPAGGLARIGGGRNSQVYRVDGANGRCFVMKLYFRDERRRRATEFEGLSFLWNNGIRRIPQPLDTDELCGASLFSFVAGAPVSGPEATEADIDACASFLIGLRDLTNRLGAENLPAASEATFSLRALADSIQRRYARLREIPTTGPLGAEMQAFIRWEFEPALRALSEWAGEVLRARGLSPSDELPAPMRTLSPSDFGFHNALRTESGLVFVDFEYFGWDDPAKMICDFLLHPGMDLSRRMRGCFLRRLLQDSDPVQELDTRTRVGYAMYGLKWCTIMLNEFVPEHLERRLFNDPKLNVDEHQRRQLAKARLMLVEARAAQTLDLVQIFRE